MKSTILDETGANAQTKTQPEPPHSGEFFGWLDERNEPKTVRLDSIVLVCQNTGNARYSAILRDMPPQMTVIDIPTDQALNLLQRLGWTLK